MTSRSQDSLRQDVTEYCDRLMSRDVVDILNLHFQWLGEPVTCTQVKPCLPTLALPGPGIRIPTPITVHVDQCPACATDLERLSRLGLEPGQLERLARVYAAQAGEFPAVCAQARPQMAALAAASTENIGPELLSHLCGCRECRNQVFECRQRLLESLTAPGAPSGMDSCGHVPMGGLFDFAVPPDLAGIEETQTRTPPRPAAAHVRNCHRCLAKVQDLHRLVYGIAERPDSGVATVYTTINDADEEHRPDALYPDYPIRVEVTRASSGRVRTPHHSTCRPGKPEFRISNFETSTNDENKRPRPGGPLRGRLSRLGFLGTLPLPWRSFLTAAAIMAALLPLMLLFLRTAPGSGLTFAQVADAFDHAANIHVARFYTPTDELIEELWIARAQDLCWRVIGEQRTLYDLGQRTKYVYSTLDRSADVTALSEVQYANVRRLVDTWLDYDFRRVPAGATWRHGPDEADAGGDPYELTYTGQDGSGHSYYLRWIIWADPVTKLPQEVEQFARASTDHEWESQCRTEFQYLTDEEMAAAVGEPPGGSGVH